MVKNSDKTYGQLIVEAKMKTDKQEVGETVSELSKYFIRLVEEICQQQAERCIERGFRLSKYYIWIGLRKSDLTANALHIIPTIRVSRPTPDHTIFKDSILWSVTDMNKIKYEWNVIADELANYILNNKPRFDVQTILQAIKQKTNKIDKIEDYIINDKLM